MILSGYETEYFKKLYKDEKDQNQRRCRTDRYNTAISLDDNCWETYTIPKGCYQDREVVWWDGPGKHASASIGGIMGRPTRRDVDYFPFYAKEGRTLFVLEGKYQCKGTGFFTNLLRFLSRTPDHYFSIKDPGDALFFFASTKCDPESGIDMINMMVKTGKLDAELWEKYQILASADFLDSIADAYRKRNLSCITMKEIKNNLKILGEFPAEETPFPAEETEFPAAVIRKVK